jgi:hypothetical protein
MKKHIWQLFCLLLCIICCSALPTQTGFAQAAGVAQCGVFESNAIQPGSRLEIPVEIRDVEDLYAIDIEIQFDPAVIQFEDADPKTEGIQPALGTFLDVGMALFNTIDNTNGVVRFVMTQVNPSEGKTGSGVVLVLYAVGIAEGESPLTISFLELANRAGEVIAVDPASAVVTVASDAVEKESTPIAVQDSSGMISVPTLQPTEAATPEPTESGEDSLRQSDSGEIGGADQDVIERQQESTPSESNEIQSGFSLVRYWWVVAIVAVVVVGLAIYLLVTKK